MCLFFRQECRRKAKDFTAPQKVLEPTLQRGLEQVMSQRLSIIVVEKDRDRAPLIDAGSPSRDALEELTLASGPLERPVAMFVDQSDGSLTRAAIEAGVSA